MISFFKNLKFNKLNRGMSYVELIVVLSIFAVISTVATFNFGSFQGKVDIKNLTTDIALKIIEAQKSSLSGTLPPPAQRALIGESWKPSYGLYFNLLPSLPVDSTSLIYFTDINQNEVFNGAACDGECLEKITITRGNTISNLDVFYINGTSAALDDLTITFARPDSRAIMKSSDLSGSLAVSYTQIKISSPKGITNIIKIYPSGRIQVD